jgi:hypothetical protein
MTTKFVSGETLPVETAIGKPGRSFTRVTAAK